MSASSQSHYAYRQFRDAAREIRLLRLLPKLAQLPNGDEVSQGTLHHVPPQKDLGYASLSYVWGKEQDTASMLIDGKRKNITTNLSAFLLQAAETLRTSNYDSAILGVDAVCIKEDDDAEKSQQVSMLRQIFGVSQRTVLWLGPSDEDPMQGFEWLSICADVKPASG